MQTCCRVERAADAARSHPEAARVLPPTRQRADCLQRPRRRRREAAARQPPPACSLLGENESVQLSRSPTAPVNGRLARGAPPARSWGARALLPPQASRRRERRRAYGDAGRSGSGAVVQRVSRARGQLPSGARLLRWEASTSRCTPPRSCGRAHRGTPTHRPRAAAWRRAGVCTTAVAGGAFAARAGAPARRQRRRAPTAGSALASPQRLRLANAGSRPCQWTRVLVEHRHGGDAVGAADGDGDGRCRCRRSSARVGSSNGSGGCRQRRAAAAVHALLAEPGGHV